MQSTSTFSEVADSRSTIYVKNSEDIFQRIWATTTTTKNREKKTVGKMNRYFHNNYFPRTFLFGCSLETYKYG